MHALPIQTPHGEFFARYSGRGLAEVRFPSREKLTESNAPNQMREWHSLSAAAIKALLAGEVPNILPPLDLSGHTEFQRSVWHQLRQIPLGQTLSYAEVAQRIGNPGATRAVGSACGANPIPVIIPCHRVLGANRTLGGFSGGLDWKRKLLAIEGVAIEAATAQKHQQELLFT